MFIYLQRPYDSPYFLYMKFPSPRGDIFMWNSLLRFVRLHLSAIKFYIVLIFFHTPVKVGLLMSFWNDWLCSISWFCCDDRWSVVETTIHGKWFLLRAGERDRSTGRGIQIVSDQRVRVLHWFDLLTQSMDMLKVVAWALVPVDRCKHTGSQWGERSWSGDSFNKVERCNPRIILWNLDSIF